MVAKRIIPCLDIDNNRTVKGVNFKNLVDAGDPIELARIYSEKGADELVFLDITATKDKRKTLSSLAEKISENINIPFTVGGGIRNIDDVTSLLLSGADKITINTQAVKTPNLINEISSRYGNQCVVVAIDAKKIQDDWYVYLVGGREKTNKKLINVFVPTTPNPTSGFLLMFPAEDVIYLNMTFEEASKFIVSAGTSSGKN